MDLTGLKEQFEQVENSKDLDEKEKDKRIRRLRRISSVAIDQFSDEKSLNILLNDPKLMQDNQIVYTIKDSSLSGLEKLDLISKHIDKIKPFKILDILKTLDKDSMIKGYEQFQDKLQGNKMVSRDPFFEELQNLYEKTQLNDNSTIDKTNNEQISQEDQTSMDHLLNMSIEELESLKMNIDEKHIKIDKQLEEARRQKLIAEIMKKSKELQAKQNELNNLKGEKTNEK